MGWCQHQDSKLWKEESAIPCGVATAAGPSILALAAFLCYGQWRRRRTLKNCPAYRYRSGATSMQQAVVEVGALLVYGLLAAKQLAWICVEGVTDAPPYVFFYSACLLTTWLLALGAATAGRRAHVYARMRTLCWGALLLYAYLIWDSAARLRYSSGSARTIDVAQTVTSCISFAALLGLSVADCSLKPDEEEENTLKAALLGAHDVEARGAESPWKKRGWWSLMVAAIVYVWPVEPVLQLRAAVCVILVICMRLLNLAVPILYRDVINLMSDVSTGGDKPQVTFWMLFYPVVLLYLAAVLLQGGSGAGSIGILNNLRSFFWIPITQDAYRRISLDVFSHTLDLDLKFHLMRKTGEVTRIMDRGTSAIQNVLSTVLFNIIPQLFDVLAATLYIAGVLTPWIAVILFVTLGSYIPVTILLTEWRGSFRRDLNKYDNARSAKVTDALLGYETVKYFSNEGMERSRFADAIRDYLKVDYQLTASLCALNIVQSLIIWAGLASGLVVCVKGIAAGTLRVGDLVLFLTMLTQLQGPLNFFGTYYRTIQQQMIDMENMFGLLATNTAIKDRPGAKELVVGPGKVEFRDVSFEYTAGAPVLNDVSFLCAGGRTTAFVGATGSGKSTVLRLVFRFYDPLAGSILIDGQDIAHVTLRSLRAHMAVVPQDTVLFNDTIQYNIRYGRPEASDEEVEAAASSASIHDAITDRFPQGYGTIVGERGLRLSGGEKQRIAFARSLLKNPRILLLDEATSALDSLTERRIQEALLLLRRDRTTLIVAHRLSTVADANLIVVMQEGRVAEMGSHVELLGRSGLYAQMWARQAEAGGDSRPSSSTNLAGLEEAVSRAGALVPQRRGGPAGDPPLARHGHGGHGFHG